MNVELKNVKAQVPKIKDKQIVQYNFLSNWNYIQRPPQMHLFFN